MRSARAQVALESVLLKCFDKPSQTLERRIIQSPEFRDSISKLWAKKAVHGNRAYTEDTIQELLKVKVNHNVSLL